MVIESRKSVAPVGIYEAQQEMYADFCGEVLFSNNQNALNRLMDSLDKKERPKFIQFILDFITYLKEKIAARQVIHGNSVAEWRSQISNFFNKALKNGPLEIKTIEGDILTISKDTAKKARSKAVVENGVVRELTDKEFLVKLNAEAHIDELAEISKRNKGNVVPDSKNHNFAKDGFTYRTVYFQDFDNAYYRVTLSVGENNGISTVYNVGKIKADDIPDGNIISTIGSKADMSSAENSISTNEPDVNQEYLTAVNNKDIRYSISSDIDNSDYSGYNTHYGENLKNTPEYLLPTTDREWQVFTRSFANKTNGMKRGERRKISVFTADYQYLIDADGYMNGVICSKVDLNAYEEGEEYYDNGSASNVNGQDETNGYRQGDNGYHGRTFEDGREDSFYVELDNFIARHPELATSDGTTEANHNKRVEAERNDSAFSMPENKKYSVSTDNTQHRDIPAEMQRLIQQRDNGELDADAFTEQMDVLKTHYLYFVPIGTH